MAIGALEVAARRSVSLAVRLERVARPGAVWWMVAGAVFVVMSRFVARSPYVVLGAPPPPREVVAQSVLQTVVAFVLVGAVVFGGERSFVVRLAGWRPFVALGTISYSLYLWHLLVLYQWDWSRAPSAGAAWWRGGAAFVLTVAIATVSYLLIERPAIRVSHAVARRSPGSANGSGSG